VTLAAGGLATGAAIQGTPATAQSAGFDPNALAAQISSKLFADDGLARPAPESPAPSNLAKGLDRTLVLGGGGEYYVAWYCGFFHGLYGQFRLSYKLSTKIPRRTNLPLRNPG
jgi:NTE family protein